MSKGLFFMHNSGHQGFVTTKTPGKWERFILFFFCLFHFSDSVCYDTHNCGSKKVAMSQRALTYPQSAPLKCWKAKTLRSWPGFIVGLVQFILLKIYFKKRWKWTRMAPASSFNVYSLTRWFTHPGSLSGIFLLSWVTRKHTQLKNIRLVSLMLWTQLVVRSDFK